MKADARAVLMRGRQARQMYTQKVCTKYTERWWMPEATAGRIDGDGAEPTAWQVARGMANQLVLERDAALASQRDAAVLVQSGGGKAARDQTGLVQPPDLQERVAEEAKQEDLERVGKRCSAVAGQTSWQWRVCAGRGASGEVVADAKHELANGRDEGSEAMAPAARRAAPHGSADRWLAPGEEVKTVRPKAGAESCTTVTAVHVPPPAVHARSTRGPRVVHACLSNAVMLNQPSVESKPQISFPCGRMWS